MAVSTFAALRRKLSGNEQKTLPALPRRNPDVTQKYHVEHYNVAGDYLYGLKHSEKKLTMDEYVHMVRSFGKWAHSMETPDDRLLPKYEELSELVDLMDSPEVICVEEEGIE